MRDTDPRFRLDSVCFNGCLVTKVMVKDTSHWVDGVLSWKCFGRYNDVAFQAQVTVLDW